MYIVRHTSDVTEKFDYKDLTEAATYQGYFMSQRGLMNMIP